MADNNKPDTPAEGAAAETKAEPTTSAAEAAPSAQPAERPRTPRDDGDDDDSALDSDAASSTASLTASILEYRKIHNRTYHSERGNALYWATNDDQQNESQDINHHALLLLFDGKLHQAPLKENIQKVLDIGTGTGMWAIDFAEDHPQAEVIGTDISPIQPRWVPPNLKFEIEDCTQEWTFRQDTYDFVHMRILIGSISDWSALFNEAYKTLKPGGWVESLETSPHVLSDDGSVGEGSAMSQWGNIYVDAGKKIGRSFTILDDDIQRKCMEEAGFVDIRTIDGKAPIGSWPRDKKLKEIARFSQAALFADIEGYVLFMANQVLGWTKEEVTVYCARLRQEIRSGQPHPYYKYRVAYGRKPE